MAASSIHSPPLIAGEHLLRASSVCVNRVRKTKELLDLWDTCSRGNKVPYGGCILSYRMHGAVQSWH
ncbi:hypothetical protein HPP92_025396 [Vanilla planifolia]|uniref:Uncharacterized protein n=1 Tax=Vanilla planifolia TaxID=51239 RepID=A0A835PJH4_VANPL|nr:hypothetical protein HPP92_025396 [Vanilla planifolia]